MLRDPLGRARGDPRFAAFAYPGPLSEEAFPLRSKISAPHKDPPRPLPVGKRGSGEGQRLARVMFGKRGCPHGIWNKVGELFERILLRRVGL